MTALWPGRGGPTINYISEPPAPEALQGRRPLVILGSTGSIGGNALKVIRAHADRFRILGLACARNVAVLAAQAAEFRPPFLAVLDEQAAADLRAQLNEARLDGYAPKILIGPDGYARMASLPETRMVLSAQVGAAGLAGTLAAALAGKIIALANKESLVLASDLLRRICTARGAVILPVDSEHNALFQCLAGRGQDAQELILTASGGPFRGRSRAELLHVTREQALKHPNWSMGAKITIDSATMMNKALEVVEAYHLYGIPADAIRVAVHPQSVVHSLVRFRDGGLLAQMGPADMRLPIGHCLLWPECLSVNAPGLDLFSCGPLEFFEPDPEAFPAVSLAWQALKRRGGTCVVMNAANEAAVELFLAGHCGFTDITDIIAEVMARHERESDSSQPWSLPDPAIGPESAAAHACEAMERIIHLDQQSRALARKLARSGVNEC